MTSNEQVPTREVPFPAAPAGAFVGKVAHAAGVARAGRAMRGELTIAAERAERADVRTPLHMVSTVGIALLVLMIVLGTALADR
jgi:hypothetical protein